MSYEEAAAEALDAIYEAALDPDRWPTALSAIVRALDANSSCFTTCHVATGRLEMLPIGIGENAAADYTRHYARIDPLMPPILAAPRGNAYSDVMFVPRDEMERTETYRDWAVPNGIRSAAVMVLREDAGQLVTLAVMRERRDDEFAASTLRRFERLGAHVRRALQVQQRLGIAITKSAALDRLGMAILSVEPTGRILYANRAAEDLLSDGNALRTDRGVLRCARPLEMKMLQGLLHRGSGTMRLPRSRRAPLGVIVAPQPPGHPLLGDRKLARLVFVSDPESRSTAAIEHLQALYRLTPMQTAIALEVACGDGIDAAAARLGVSRGTARSHLAQVFAKTRTRRQAELVRLLVRSVPDLRDEG